MDTPSEIHLVDELCAETERAWVDRRDASVVDRLAGEHPEHASELYEFFSSLVYSSRESTISEQIPEQMVRRATERTRDWLDREGFEMAQTAILRARGPLSFIQYLSQRTREDPDVILRKIKSVTWEFLVMVSRYPAVVPPEVRQELASRIAKGWDITREECLSRIENSGLVPIAASRDSPFPGQPTSFAELLERSALNKKQRSYWTGLMSDQTDLA